MEKLYLGVAREIITPPLELKPHLAGYAQAPVFERIADDLTATAFYFQQGNVKALMVSVTICIIDNPCAEEILSQIEQEFAIPRACCMICATHTHTGPFTGKVLVNGLEPDTRYVEQIYIPNILAAVRKAIQNPQPVEMGIACGDSFVGVNRRELQANNKVRLGQNPWGCFDPRMTVVSFRGEDGKTVANMVHYGAHCTAAGCVADVSRDWPGVMTDTLDVRTGGITAFFNGSEGDVGPRLTNGMTAGDLPQMRELGAVAAQDAATIYRNIFDYHDVSLKTSSVNLQLPLKKRISLEAAQEKYRMYEGKKVVAVEFLRKTTLEDIIASYTNGYEEQEFVTVTQNIIALGNLAFVSFPYEQFCEIGLRIDQYTPNYRVLPLSNTNGFGSYFITEDAICRGGYEVSLFREGHIQPLVDNADWYLVQGTIEHFQTMED